MVTLHDHPPSSNQREILPSGHTLLCFSPQGGTSYLLMVRDTSLLMYVLNKMHAPV